MIAFGIPKEATKIFEYNQENGYQTGEKFVNQIWGKALLITQALYSKYQILFIFDNEKSHAVFAGDIFWIGNMNKKVRSA